MFLLKSEATIICMLGCDLHALFIYLLRSQIMTTLAVNMYKLVALFCWKNKLQGKETLWIFYRK